MSRSSLSFRLESGCSLSDLTSVHCPPCSLLQPHWLLCCFRNSTRHEGCCGFVPSAQSAVGVCHGANFLTSFDLCSNVMLSSCLTPNTDTSSPLTSDSLPVLFSHPPPHRIYKLLGYSLSLSISLALIEWNPPRQVLVYFSTGVSYLFTNVPEPVDAQ